MILGFLREANWLHADRVRGYLNLVALMNVVFVALWFATSHDGRDLFGNPIGTDFLSFWTAGQMLQEHQNVYDISAHAALQRSYFMDDSGYYAFFYPPSFLLWCWPLGKLAFLPALIVWLTVTGAAFALATLAWRDRMAIRLPVAILLAAFPATLLTILHGQTTFLLAACLGLGLLWVRSHPWWAGLMLGLATLKPQFGLLIPIGLIMTGQWRTVGAALLTALGIVIATSVAFGPHVWQNWLGIIANAHGTLDSGAVAYSKFISPFAAIKLLGGTSNIAWLIQALFVIAVFAAIVKASWRRPYDLRLASAMLAGTMLVTPFALDYDMLLLAFPLLFLVASELKPWNKLIVTLAFIAPLITRPLATHLGLPIAPIVMLALFVTLMRHNSQPRKIPGC